MSENAVDGKRIAIDADRSVWLGYHEDSFCIVFTNKTLDEPETFIRLSPEGMRALVTLYEGHMGQSVAHSLDSVLDRLPWLATRLLGRAWIVPKTNDV